MSFPVASFDWVGEVWNDETRSCEDEWSIECDLCHRIGLFSGHLYKVVDQPEEEGWTMANGRVWCELCCGDDRQEDEIFLTTTKR